MIKEREQRKYTLNQNVNRQSPLAVKKADVALAFNARGLEFRKKNILL